MIRLIAIDMDGTLLNQNHQVSERNRQAVLQAQKSGIEVVVATGRGFPEAEHPALQAQLDVGYICLNGAETRDRNGEISSSIYLDEEQVPKILAILNEESIESLLFIGDHMYVRSIENLIAAFIDLGKDAGQTPDVEAIRAEVMDRVDEGYVRSAESFTDLISMKGDQVYKFFGSSANPNVLDRAAKKLEQLPNIAVTSSGSKNIETTSIHAQKGIALEQYVKDRGISLDQVMVIGDSYNDLSMIKKAKISYAMKNAPDDIKAACTNITTSNENDGVAAAIEDVLAKQVI